MAGQAKEKMGQGWEKTKETAESGKQKAQEMAGRCECACAGFVPNLAPRNGE